MVVGNRVLIVDGDTGRREALCAAIRRALDLELVGAAGSGRQGVAELLKSYPDMVLIAHELPDIAGTETARAMVYLMPAVKIILITPPLKGDHLIQAVASGVKDCVDERASSADIAEFLRKIIASQHTFSPGFLDALIDALQAQSATSG